MNKKMLTIVGVIVAVLLLVILILPSLIDANRYKPEIQAKLGTALGRNVQIGNIKLSIFSGGVVVDDVAISDDPAFSHSQFLAAKELTVGVHLIPLIFSKQLEIESITIKDPQVTLLRNNAGVWNYSSMGGGASKTEAKTPSSPSSANSLSVGKIEITNGKISVGTRRLAREASGLSGSESHGDRPFLHVAVSIQAFGEGSGQWRAENWRAKPDRSIRPMLRSRRSTPQSTYSISISPPSQASRARPLELQAWLISMARSRRTESR